MKKSLLTACAAALVLVLSACAQQPRTLDVSGTVIDLRGAGLGGVNVVVGDKSTTTAADGSFSFEGLDVPYDLLVYSADTGHVFEGLNTGTPVVLPIEALVSTVTTSATVDGSLSVAVPAGHVAQVCVEGIDVEVTGCQSVGSGLSNYSVTARWSEGGTINVRVHALFIALDGDGLPTGYAEYGTATGSISEGGSTTIPVTMDTGPTATTISGTVALPAGFDLDSLAGSVRLSADYVLPIFNTSSGTLTSSFTISMPELGESSYALVAQGSPASVNSTGLGWVHDVAPGSSPTIEVAPAPGFVTPANGATGVTTETEFTIDGIGEGANTFLFDGPEAIAVTSTDKTETIPDLSEYGLPLATGGATYDVTALHSPAYNANSATTGWYGDYYDAFLGVREGGNGADVDAGISAAAISVTTE